MNMKKLHIILFIIPLIFTSCETDDNNQNNGSNNVNDTSGSILGTWELTYYELTYYEIYLDPTYGNEVTQEVTQETEESDPLDLRFITFRYDNSLIYEYADGDTTMTTYLQTDNILELTGEPTSYNITTLNENNLSFNGEIEDQEIANDTTFISRATIFVDFVKVIGRSSNNLSSIKKLNSSENSFGFFGRNKSSNK